jgi:hypothetical protein
MYAQSRRAARSNALDSRHAQDGQTPGVLCQFVTAQDRLWFRAAFFGDAVNPSGPRKTAVGILVAAGAHGWQLPGPLAANLENSYGRRDGVVRLQPSRRTRDQPGPNRSNPQVESVTGRPERSNRPCRLFSLLIHDREHHDGDSVL